MADRTFGVADLRNGGPSEWRTVTHGTYLVAATVTLSLLNERPIHNLKQTYVCMYVCVEFKTDHRACLRTVYVSKALHDCIDSLAGNHSEISQLAKRNRRADASTLLCKYVSS